MLRNLLSIWCLWHLCVAPTFGEHVDEAEDTPPPSGTSGTIPAPEKSPTPPNFDRLFEQSAGAPLESEVATNFFASKKDVIDAAFESSAPEAQASLQGAFASAIGTDPTNLHPGSFGAFRGKDKAGAPQVYLQGLVKKDGRAFMVAMSNDGKYVITDAADFNGQVKGSGGAITRVRGKNLDDDGHIMYWDPNDKLQKFPILRDDSLRNGNISVAYREVSSGLTIRLERPGVDFAKPDAPRDPYLEATVQGNRIRIPVVEMIKF